MESNFDQYWQSIIACGGQVFRQVGGGEFIYKVSATGSSVMLSRTNQSLGRAMFEKAWRRRPISGPSAINDLRGPSYLYAILSDPRIGAI
jgi:hypothetical protein